MIVLKSFYLNNRNSYTIDCSLNKPLELMDTHKEYYLQLSQISFVNCVANVTEDLIIPAGKWMINGVYLNPGIVVGKGQLLSLPEIYTQLNNYIIQRLGENTITFQLNNLTGKCEIVFGENCASVNIDPSGSLLTTKFFGFKDTDIINNTHIKYSSSISISVSEDNQFGLYCNITSSSSYINNDDGEIVESTLIWTDNLISERFGTISLKANIPIYFKINNSFLQNFRFSIKRLDSSDFTLVKGVDTDFFVSFNIVERIV